MSFAGKLVELEIIMLSRVNHLQNDKGHTFSLTFGRYIQKLNIHKEGEEKRMIKVNKVEIYLICVGRQCKEMD
jgi:hypothetical protein